MRSNPQRWRARMRRNVGLFVEKRMCQHPQSFRRIGSCHRGGSEYAPIPGKIPGEERLRHAAMHRQNGKGHEQQAGEQGELYVAPATQKMTQIPQMLRQRHYQHEQSSQKHQQTSHRPMPLIAVCY